MSDAAALAAKVRNAYNECFGCGLDNPIGLRLDGFAIEGPTVRADFTPRPEFRGFHGILHGGVVATLLDETLAWTAMLLEGTYVVTASLELKFRNPAPSDSSYEVEGTVRERRGRRLRMNGAARAGGKLVAEAAGLFLATEPVT